MSENEVTIKEFNPKFYSISEVEKELEGKKIDMRKTIEKIMSRDIDIAPEGMIHIGDPYTDMWKIENEYDGEIFAESQDKLTDEFYKKLEEFRNEGKYIYISTVYATDEIAGSNTLYEYITEGEDYNTVGILSYLGYCDLKLSDEYSSGDLAGDYGIMIDGDNISFQKFSMSMGCGPCGVGGSTTIEPLNYILDPLDSFAVETMLEIMEFED